MINCIVMNKKDCWGEKDHTLGTDILQWGSWKQRLMAVEIREKGEFEGLFK